MRSTFLILAIILFSTSSVAQSNETSIVITKNGVDFPNDIPTIEGVATAAKHAVNKETMDAAIASVSALSSQQFRPIHVTTGRTITVDDLLNGNGVISLDPNVVTTGSYNFILPESLGQDGDKIAFRVYKGDAKIRVNTGGNDDAQNYDNKGHFGYIKDHGKWWRNGNAEDVVFAAEYMTMSNATSDPNGNESDATAGYAAYGATIESSESDNDLGSHTLKIVATENNGNDSARYVISGLDASKSYTLKFRAKATGTDSYLQIYNVELDGTQQILQKIGATYQEYVISVNPSGASLTLRFNVNLQNGVGAIGDVLYVSQVSFTENL